MPFLRGVQGECRKWTGHLLSEGFRRIRIISLPTEWPLWTIKDVCQWYTAPKRYTTTVLPKNNIWITCGPDRQDPYQWAGRHYANPTFLPEELNAEYAKYWTDERIDRVLDVLKKHNIALEINARYKIPSFDIIRKAKERGIKFTFGTNNVDAISANWNIACKPSTNAVWQQKISGFRLWAYAVLAKWCCIISGKIFSLQIIFIFRCAVYT